MFVNKLKIPFSEQDAGVDLPSLGCVYVLNRLVNGLEIYLFTYTI